MTNPLSEAGTSVRLSAYEAQVLIGASISGCNMSPDRVFDLQAAWSRLHALGLIDRTDGLAIATPEGVALIASMLAVLNAALIQPTPAETEGEALAVMLASRDAFIVSRDLWSDFVASLPDQRRAVKSALVARVEQAEAQVSTLSRQLAELRARGETNA